MIFLKKPSYAWDKMKTDEIKEIMTKIIIILLDAGMADWSAAITKLSHEMDVDPDCAKKKVLRLYGGMGSFNDIIIYKNGELLVKKTNEFYELKMNLFELCKPSGPPLI
jgi:hypothetical protein